MFSLKAAEAVSFIAGDARMSCSDVSQGMLPRKPGRTHADRPHFPASQQVGEHSGLSLRIAALTLAFLSACGRRIKKDHSGGQRSVEVPSHPPFSLRASDIISEVS